MQYFRIHFKLTDYMLIDVEDIEQASEYNIL